MGSEQRWRWAWIVSGIGIAGVLVTDIVANVVGGYITDRLKGWQLPDGQQAVTGAAIVASLQTAPTSNAVAKAPLAPTDEDDARLPETETVAARGSMPLPETEPEPLPEPTALPPQPEMLRGSVEKVIDTGTLRIGGEIVLLAGVEGLGSPYRDQLAKFIEEQGSSVRCMPSGMRHTCFVSEVDLALAALTNGAARLASDATDKYREAEGDARRNRRGIFR
jgi:endonuclease YncB( thermonuclease family)